MNGKREKAKKLIEELIEILGALEEDEFDEELDELIEELSHIMR